MKKYFFVFYIIIYCPDGLQQLAAQTNFLLNSGFEDINTCSEYNAQCGVEAWFYLKDVKAQMMTNRANAAELGNNSFAIFYSWLGYEAFTPVIGTVLPCGLQKGKKYIFSGLFSAQLNPKLLLRPGIAIGSKFYVPKRPFSGPIQPDSILDIKVSTESEFYEFKYQFTADGTERYLTFGTYIKEDLTASKKKLFSKQDISLRLDNFSLTPVDHMEGICEAFQQNQKIIYDYNFRHKEMDYSLYAKGELAVNLFTADSTYITQKRIDPPAIIADTLRLGDVFFDFDKSQLKPEADRMLTSFFNKEAMLTSFDSIYIEGHTDSVGGDAHNLQLSRLRCEEIKKWMIQKKLFVIQNIQIRPFGKTKPIATNSTVQGRALNRRVEIIVLHNYKK